MKFLFLGGLLSLAPCLMADEQDDLRKLLEISATKEAPSAPAPAPTTIPKEEFKADEAVPGETPPEAADSSSSPSDPVGEPVVEAQPVAPPQMTSYKVWIWQESGDTLWRIAQKVYGDKDKWRLIYLANKDVIKDPNRIYPKQKLKIPPADWQP